MEPENRIERPAGAVQTKYTVTERETDAGGLMRPSALLRAMQLASWANLAPHGLDCEALLERGLLWMLVRTGLELQRLPRRGETVQIRTWWSEEKHWMFSCRYQCFSETGELLASAASLWALAARMTRSLASPEALGDAFPDVRLPDGPELPARRMPFPDTLPGLAYRTVQSEEIDLNGHMNNTCYLDWAMELPELEILRGKKLCRVWVEYGMELLEGQQSENRYALEGNKLFLRGFRDGENTFSLCAEYD